MAINFPDLPVDQQTFTVNNTTYVWWANASIWVVRSQTSNTVTSVTGTSGQIYSSSGTTPTLNLISTGVVSNIYGGASSIPVINIDAYGRITSASNVTVQGMDYAYANAVGAASNSYTNLAFTAANTSQYTANLAFDKANTGGVPISDVAPSNPAANSLWWSSDLGRLFVFYNDGSSAQWVEASPDTLASNQQLVSKINTSLQNSTGAFAGTLTVTGGVNTNTISTSTNVASFGTALRILANGDIVISGNIIML